MSRTLIVYFLLGIFSVKGQSIDFYCDGQRHSYRYEVWTVPVQDCKGYRFFNPSTNINDIPFKDSIIINSIKQNLRLRAGNELYEKFEIYDITIAPDTNECNNMKYSIRYLFRLDSLFYHRFSLTFDPSGNLISSFQFPDISTNKNPLDIIHYCTALDIALNNISFKESCDKSGLSIQTPNKKTGEMETLLNISRFNLGYNLSLNVWTWEIYSETTIPKKNRKKNHASGKWTGKKVIINAQTSDIINIEDFYEYKIVCY